MEIFSKLQRMGALQHSGQLITYLIIVRIDLLFASLLQNMSKS